MKSTCVLVLGTPRSGTSCIAGILNKLDLFVGNRLLPASPMNEMGFYQDEDFDDLFQNIPDWMPPFPPPYPLCDTKELEKLLKSRDKNHTVWAVKFRLAAYVIDEIEKVCDTKLIIARRPRQQSIDSLNYWLVPEDQPAEQIIDRSQSAIDAAAVGRNVLNIPYDDLLASTAQTVQLISNFVQKPVKQAAIDFVDPALRRYR